MSGDQWFRVLCFEFRVWVLRFRVLNSRLGTRNSKLIVRVWQRSKRNILQECPRLRLAVVYSSVQKRAALITSDSIQPLMQDSRYRPDRVVCFFAPVFRSGQRDLKLLPNRKRCETPFRRSSRLRQFERLKRSRRDEKHITLLFAKSVFKQHGILIKQARLNFLQTQRNRLSKGCVPGTALPNLSLYLVVFCSEGVQLSLTCSSPVLQCSYH